MANKASGITLAPVRMGDLLSKTTIAPSNLRSGYVPPHMRQVTVTPDTVALPEKISLVETDFPTMGSPSPAKSKSPKSPSINFKKAVDDHLEREKLTEAERNKVPEQDIMKMTSEQLEAGGWLRLSLDVNKVPYYTEEADVPYDFGAFPTKTTVDEMEEEADLVFKTYMANDDSDAMTYKLKATSTPYPLNEACLRYRRN